MNEDISEKGILASGQKVSRRRMSESEESSTPHCCPPAEPRQQRPPGNDMCPAKLRKAQAGGGHGAFYSVRGIAGHEGQTSGRGQADGQPGGPFLLPVPWFLPTPIIHLPLTLPAHRILYLTPPRMWPTPSWITWPSDGRQYPLPPRQRCPQMSQACMLFQSSTSPGKAHTTHPREGSWRDPWRHRSCLHGHSASNPEPGDLLKASRIIQVLIRHLILQIR